MKTRGGSRAKSKVVISRHALPYNRSYAHVSQLQAGQNCRVPRFSEEGLFDLESVRLYRLHR